MVDGQIQKNMLFKPSRVRSVQGRTRVSNISLASQNAIQDAQEKINISNKSFLYDSSGAPFKSTQQLNVDFSKFENHTFFNSAQNKTKIAINKIINNFPFDGSKSEIENFVENLTGFERYVYDELPKNVGFILFDGSNSIVVNDTNNNSNDGYSNNFFLDFKSGPFSIEFNLMVKNDTINAKSWICQRLSKDQTGGFFVGLGNIENSSNDFEINFAIINGDQKIIASTLLQKNEFHHVNLCYDALGSQKLKIYVDGELSAESASQQRINPIIFDQNNKFTIASGISIDAVQQHYPNVFPNDGNKLIAAINNFRFFHSTRNVDLIKKYSNKEIFSEPDLKLHFKFNEPYGLNLDLVLDHSGNRMHSKISDFNIEQRNYYLYLPNYDNLKDSGRSPILFMDFDSVKSFFKSLIAEAVQFDSYNPNIITKLVPPHYILAEQNYANSYDPAIEDYYEEVEPLINEPGGAKQPEVSVMISMMLIWAEAFDDIKMFIDELGRLSRIDYIEENTISNHLLPYIARQYDLELPTFFQNTSLDTFTDGRNARIEETLGQQSIIAIQNAMWRRLLSDAVQIRRSKGTKAGIRSVLRNTGINPYGPFRIKEYGGSKTSRITDQYEFNQKSSDILNLKSSFASKDSDLIDGTNSKVPLFRSPFLTADRVEPGYPNPTGDVDNDSLLTLYSWAVEGRFKLDSSLKKKQSLLRVHTTGSTVADDSVNHLLFNVVAHPPNRYERRSAYIELWARPQNDQESEFLNLRLDNVNLFDGNDWYVSISRKHADGVQLLSSSYHLYAGRMKSTGVEDFRESQGYLDDADNNLLSFKDDFGNKNGCFVAVGSMSLGNQAEHCLNGLEEANASWTDFEGKLSRVRFYSKHLDASEARTHLLNPMSAGVSDPIINYGFNKNSPGSFERLRMDISMDQEEKISDENGHLIAFDFSQNGLHGTITGIEPFKSPFFTDTFTYQQLSSKLEASQADNKVRARSFQSFENIVSMNGLPAPLWELPPDEEPKEDRRVEIEASIVQALNEDIATIFSSLDGFNNYIGNPELIFSREYKSLRNLRRIYFNKLTDKLKIGTFFEFFKWFDATIGDILEDMIPYNSQFLGTNFVVESHALERPKFTYSYYDMYLGEIDRRAASTIKLQLFTGNLRKF